MQRTLLIAVLALAAACGSDNGHIPDGRIPDAKPIDASIPDAAGSGSDLTMMEPSPHDHGLDLVVVGASMVIVVGPIRRSRRRRENDAA